MRTFKFVGPLEARLLLKKIEQPERWIEVSARIAKAVNRE
jgi:hypothetical protein